MDPVREFFKDAVELVFRHLAPKYWFAIPAVYRRAFVYGGLLGLAAVLIYRMAGECRGDRVADVTGCPAEAREEGEKPPA